MNIMLFYVIVGATNLNFYSPTYCDYNYFYSVVKTNFNTSIFIN